MKSIIIIFLLFCFIMPLYGDNWGDPGNWDSFRKALEDVKYPSVFNDVVVIDNDNLEAFLIRKDGDAGDVFTVDTQHVPARIIIDNGGLYLNDDRNINFGTSADVRMRYSSGFTVDSLLLGIDKTSYNFIIGSNEWILHDFDHPASSNPTVFIHSSVDPDTDNTQYISLYHDQTYSRIVSGKGVVCVGTTNPTQSTMTSTDDLFIGGDAEIGSVLYVMHEVAIAPGAVKNISAATGITSLRRYTTVQGNGGAVVVTATPSVTAGAHGEIMTIMGWSDVNTVTLQDNDVLAGSNLELSGNVNITLGALDSVTLIYNQTVNKWIEISRSDV